MWWIIIGAVIALVVLLVVLSIFTKGTTDFNTDLFECKSKGGICVPENDCVGEKYDGTVSSFSCANEEEVCCFTQKKAESSK